MRKPLLAILAVLSLATTAAALAPHELVATKTVGHQGRAQRFRRIEGKEERNEPRICAENETPTDRDPCIGGHGRLDFTR